MTRLDYIERDLIGIRAQLQLVTSEGFAMHDTEQNVIAFQSRNDLHRIHSTHYASAIERPERVTARDVGVMVAAYLLGAMLMAASLSVLWLISQVMYYQGAEFLSEIDWAAVFDLVGVVR